MSLWFKAFDLFWGKIVKDGDDKRHAAQVLPEGIAEENDFAYLDDGNPLHLLDAYYPKDNDGRLPVIIDIHGGGWMYGDKGINKIYCEYVASRGFLVFNVSYRLVPDVRPDEQVRDCCRAIEWIRDNLSRFPADENRIMLTGDSAGGMIASYVAACSVSDEVCGRLGVAPFGMKFNCVTLTSPVSFMNESDLVGAYGRLMWGEKPFAHSPKNILGIDDFIRLAPGYPDNLLITSSGDILALKQTLKLHELFMRVGIKTRLYNFPKFEGKNLPHVFAVLEPYSNAGIKCIDTMCAFFREHF